jgi:hypothetical protein
MNTTDITIIKADIRPMDPKESSKPRELSNTAKKAVAKAINELDSGQCKTFSGIDELFDDLEND